MTVINDMPESLRKTNAKMDALERAKTRRTMDHLEELATDQWDCIGMSPLMFLFGQLIVDQVRQDHALGQRHYGMVPDVLLVIARYAEWHSVEFGDPGEQEAAEALDRVKQAALQAALAVKKHSRKGMRN